MTFPPHDHYSRRMLSGPELLTVVERGCSNSSGAELARASIIGKNEGLFRDIALNELVRTHPEWLVRAEWDTPPEAFDKFPEAIDGYQAFALQVRESCSCCPPRRSTVGRRNLGRR